MSNLKNNHTEFSEQSHIGLKRLLLILSLVFLLVIGCFIGRPLVALCADPLAFRAWIEAKGIWGILAFIGIMILQVFLAVIPAGPFQVGAGYAFGIVKGALLCDFATTLAGMLTFFFVRKFGMRFVTLFVSKTQIESVPFLKDTKRMESILFLLCLIPGTPKDLLSYCVGLTNIKWQHWLFISAVGRFPAILLSTISGSAISTAKYEHAVIAFAALIVFYIVGMIVYKYVNKKKE